jgi:hypothetical protein
MEVPQEHGERQGSRGSLGGFEQYEANTGLNRLITFRPDRAGDFLCVELGAGQEGL